MHIPDGFLSNRIALGLDAVSAASILFSARRARIDESGRTIPTMGVLAAFVFGAQLLNFPLLGGTSGHLVGGALLSILLGPATAFLTMSTVVIAQALFLQDGGLIAIGANVFNIGAVPVFVGYAVFNLLGGTRRKNLTIPAFLAGWVSLIVPAASCALQLAISGTVTVHVALPAMVGYHAIIGIAEGALTAGILSLLMKARPDLVTGNPGARFGIIDWMGALILVAAPLAIFALGGGSSLPDPLEAMLIGSMGGNGSSAPDSLLSSSRYLDYVWRILFFAVFLVLAWVVTRLAAKRSEDA
jgi:cobalt/nickel transport system permease protein